MTESLNGGEKALMMTTAALLEQGRSLDGLSRLLTTATLAILLPFAILAGGMSADTVLLVLFLALAALSGLAQLYFAFRVGFDAALFREIAAGAAIPSLDALDTSLTGLGLRPRQAHPTPLEDRIRGARKLLRHQALCLALQLAMMVVAAGHLLALQ